MRSLSDATDFERSSGLHNEKKAVDIVIVSPWRFANPFANSSEIHGRCVRGNSENNAVPCKGAYTLDGCRTAGTSQTRVSTILRQLSVCLLVVPDVNNASAPAPPPTWSAAECIYRERLKVPLSRPPLNFA